MSIYFVWQIHYRKKTCYHLGEEKKKEKKKDLFKAVSKKEIKKKKREFI